MKPFAMMTGLLAAALVAAFALSAGTLAQEKAEEPSKEAQKVLDEMKAELGDGFRFRTIRCFVVAGDIPEPALDAVSRNTVGACYDAYEKQFFKTRPSVIYRVYLFKDAKSYGTWCKKLFGFDPHTPFGFYEHGKHSLVMNISTGGGTLVHEMFHALVEPDFPDIPAWANEGLGSLFEQCNITEAGLKGLVNWRLPTLQEGIRKGTIVSLRKLMGLSDEEFRKATASGGNYAAARYFMFYLQEKGLLEQFYRKYRDGFKKDPTGVTFAEELLDRKLEEVEPEWKEWVMGLKR